MNNNRLFRNTENKMIGGVAAGIAEYLQVDTTVVRILMVLSFFIPQPVPVILIYIIFWIVMPDSAKRPKVLEQHHTAS